MGIRALYSTGRTRILTILAVVAIAATALFAVAAQAAPPAPDGCVGVDDCSLNEAAAAREAMATVPYGSRHVFAHRIEGKMAKNYAKTIQVICRQGSTPVYNWIGQTDFAFPLQAQGGNVIYWDGGDATCTALLFYKAHNRITLLDTTVFMVDGQPAE